MPVANGSFETAGARRYDAASWTSSVSVAGTEEFAEFTVDDATQGADTVETFDSGWGVFKPLFLGFFVDLTIGFFDLSTSPKDVEDFEDLWGAGPAVLITTVNGPYTLTNGSTLLIYVNGGVLQTITFVSSQFMDIASARAEEIAAAINSQLVGAEARQVLAGVEVLTTAVGGTASLQISGGTALPALLFGVEGGGPVTTPVPGTPNGGPFFHTVEFDFADFSYVSSPNNREYDNFEDHNWGVHSNALPPDPSDTSGRLFFGDDDAFEASWGSYSMSTDPTDASGRLPVFFTETYESTWPAMTTI